MPHSLHSTLACVETTKAVLQKLMPTPFTVLQTTYFAGLRKAGMPEE